MNWRIFRRGRRKWKEAFKKKRKGEIDYEEEEWIETVEGENERAGRTILRRAWQNSKKHFKRNKKRLLPARSSLGRLPSEGSNRGEDQRSERTSLRRNKEVKIKLWKEGEWMERKVLRWKRKLKRKFRKKILKRERINEKKDFKIRKNELEDRY